MTPRDLEELDNLQSCRLRLSDTTNRRRMNLLLTNARYLIECAKVVQLAAGLRGRVGEGEDDDVDDGV